jgi:3-oxoacyl-[acyl-carrier protein] reductase
MISSENIPISREKSNVLTSKRNKREISRNEDMVPTLDLSEKYCLVTGASRGIGRAIALDIAAVGATVAINYATQEVAANAVMQDIINSGGKAITLQADISDKNQVDQLFKRVLSDFGRLDILINNAGVVSYVDFLDMSEEEWDRIININLKGYFLCGQQAARIMACNNSGRIVNISSVSQVIPGMKRVHYCAAKGGVNMLTKGMAAELAQYNITVNAVAPGATHTDFTKDVLSDPEFYQAVVNKIPLSRIGQPADITGAVLLLVSDRGTYITGQTIYVDGGYLL